MWKKIKTYFIRPEFHIAFLTGIGVLAQAYFYTWIYHIELKGTILILPGLIILFYEGMIHSKKHKDKKYMKPVYWISFIILANIISILVPLFYK
ncbi:MAG: hypothetical protein GY865_03755 [candidate division Zixibacteria bacterium]|nr:hypothetical protein [candidate division Zixibacteria bacterium]